MGTTLIWVNQKFIVVVYVLILIVGQTVLLDDMLTMLVINSDFISFKCWLLIQILLSLNYLSLVIALMVSLQGC